MLILAKSSKGGEQVKIVLTGGGSGGHITPLLAVAHELKILAPDVELIYIGQKGDKLADVPREHPEISRAYEVRAGKFRRYGAGLKQVVYLSTNLKNIRDAGRVVAGFASSYRLLKKIKPDIVFIKGGFVGVPVGLAAAQLGIPYITHDSDAIPGLANRIIAKWATAHAVALPKETYPYPADKTFTVGVPVNGNFKSVDSNEIKKYRIGLGLEKYEKIVFVTGGGNGAKKLNDAVVSVAGELFKTVNGLALVHLAGRGHEEKVRKAYEKILGEKSANVFVKGFVKNLFEYSGAADLIIARGSATNLAEFALQKKACIIVPAKQLAWTLKNSQVLSREGAAIVLDEDLIERQPELLAKPCTDLLSSETKRAELGKNLSIVLAHPNASKDLARLLIKYGNNDV